MRLLRLVKGVRTLAVVLVDLEDPLAAVLILAEYLLGGLDLVHPPLEGGAIFLRLPLWVHNRRHATTSRPR